ncbi:hypothetical protein [Mesorhizobium carmichaelinearum]|uniref:hypothetical protein n=1 Tax=Mesorhizobium carmichaelinearum TaxID=1208188 RepID=UPI000BA4B618|nr:hypothetical protein [Mesorhizobium carmichaelinearum]
MRSLHIHIGDEITLSATILKVLPNDRVSISIPTFNFPFSIIAPPRSKRGDRIALIGHAIFVDLEDGKVTVKFDEGGRIAVDIASIAAWQAAPRSGASDMPD